MSIIKLNGIPAINDTKYGFVRNPEIKDRDGDGYPELMVKFDRLALVKKISKGTAVLSVIGKINGTYFIGSDIVSVR